MESVIAKELPIICVPSLSVGNLIHWSSRIPRRTLFPCDYQGGGFSSFLDNAWKAVAGMRLQPYLYEFDSPMRIEDVRSLQTRSGTDGNRAAFLVWSALTELLGDFVAVANSDYSLDSPGNYLYLPRFFQSACTCSFWVCKEFHHTPFPTGWKWVSFRVI